VFCGSSNAGHPTKLTAREGETGAATLLDSSSEKLIWLLASGLSQSPSSMCVASNLCCKTPSTPYVNTLR